MANRLPKAARVAIAKRNAEREKAIAERNERNETIDFKSDCIDVRRSKTSKRKAKTALFNPLGKIPRRSGLTEGCSLYLGDSCSNRNAERVTFTHNGVSVPAYLLDDKDTRRYKPVNVIPLRGNLHKVD